MTRMFVQSVFAGVVIACTCVFASAGAVNDPNSWNILDEHYGNGVGQVAFNDQYTLWPTSSPVTEKRSLGYTTLTLGQGDGWHFLCKEIISGMPMDNSDVTIEYKVRLVNGTPLHTYVSETNGITATNHWNSLVQVNKKFNTNVPNSIFDYNKCDKNLAPASFDGSAVNTYRIIRKSGSTALYLCNGTSWYKLADVSGTVGAALDKQNFMFGFGQDEALAAGVEIYYLKIANGAYEVDCIEVGSEKQIIEVGSEKQLFIDDYFFVTSNNIALKLNPAIKTGEYNVQKEKPWESALINWFSVIDDEGTYRMWYEAYDIEGWPTNDDTSFCYAESKDGINWVKPNLGLFEYQGSKDNNILFRQIGPKGAHSRVHGSCVFKDPSAPAESRYKAVSQGMFPAPPDYRIAGMYSSDGLRWTRYSKPIVNIFADSQYSGFWDASKGKYFLYGRTFSSGKRAVGLSTSKNFNVFSKLNTVHHVDGNDPADSDIYNSATLKYPYAQNVYLMFLSLYEHKPDTLNIRLAVSRDGVKWTYPEQDKAFIPLGADGQFDSAVLYMGQGILKVGDELWQYYSGSPIKHNASSLETVTTPGNARIFSRVISRLDGYVSVDADSKGGDFVTPSLIFKGNVLKLNVKVRDGGSLRVELLDANDQVITGRSMDDCVPITGDHISKTVMWKDDGNVSKWAGKPIKMRIEIKNASLYAFQFDKGYPYKVK